MAKKKILKKKLRVFRLLLLLLIIGIISFLVYIILNSKIKNIIISGNNYISDEEIIEKGELTDYPSFLMTIDYLTEKKIKELPAVKSVKVRKGFHNTIKIDIVEHNIVLESNNKYVLETGKILDINKNIRVPRLISRVPNKQYKNLLTNLNEIDKELLGKISEIEYTPNTYDKDRFLLYMNDDNSVYLTLTKFEMINYYDRVLAQLEGRHGILYLDNGNHFKIME